MAISSEMTAGVRGRSSTFAGLGDVNGLDVGLVRNFWRSVERIPAGGYIAASEDARKRDIVVVSGWIAETRILPDGRRQVFTFLLPGDVASVGRQTLMGSRTLLALTNVEIADAGRLGDSEERAGALVDAMRRRDERLFDHIVRIGRLTAKERVLNLLLELYDRLDSIGLVKENTFRIPLTQEVFADALGLSVVHINRTLQLLRREGMITLGRGTVTLHHRHKLASFACYQSEGQPGYERPVSHRGFAASN